MKCTENLNWLEASKKAKLTIKNKLDERIAKYNLNPSRCIYCNSVLEYKKRNNKYCNHFCSALNTTKNRNHSCETKQKISESILKRISVVGHEGIQKGYRRNGEKIIIKIPEYKNMFSQHDIDQVKSFTQLVKGKYSTIKPCRKCGSIGKVLYMGTLCNECKLKYYENYVYECKFNFDIFQFPDEFDLNLIKQYGWYSPFNKGNNLNGVSKDHIFSIKQGFLDGIDPKIIRHPSNCRLILHKENQKKNRNSLITLSDLLLKINSFNSKYTWFITRRN